MPVGSEGGTLHTTWSGGSWMGEVRVRGGKAVLDGVHPDLKAVCYMLPWDL